MLFKWYKIIDEMAIYKFNNTATYKSLAVPVAINFSNNTTACDINYISKKQYNIGIW